MERPGKGEPVVVGSPETVEWRCVIARSNGTGHGTHGVPTCVREVIGMVLRRVAEQGGGYAGGFHLVMILLLALLSGTWGGCSGDGGTTGVPEAEVNTQDWAEAGLDAEGEAGLQPTNQCIGAKPRLSMYYRLEGESRVSGLAVDGEGAVYFQHSVRGDERELWRVFCGEQTVFNSQEELDGSVRALAMDEADDLWAILVRDGGTYLARLREGHPGALWVELGEEIGLVEPAHLSLDREGHFLVCDKASGVGKVVRVGAGSGETEVVAKSPGGTGVTAAWRTPGGKLLFLADTLYECGEAMAGEDGECAGADVGPYLGGVEDLIRQRFLVMFKGAHFSEVSVSTGARFAGDENGVIFLGCEVTDEGQTPAVTIHYVARITPEAEVSLLAISDDAPVLELTYRYGHVYHLVEALSSVRGYAMAVFVY